MDSNSFVDNVGVGEREGRVRSSVGELVIWGSTNQSGVIKVLNYRKFAGVSPGDSAVGPESGKGGYRVTESYVPITAGKARLG